MEGGRKNEPPKSQRTAAELRRAFDHAFSLPHAQAVADVDDVLVVRVTGTLYGVRLREVSGIATRCHVVPVPSKAPHLMGIAGIRGALMPLFSLASILDHVTAADLSRWMLLSEAGDPIGLGFSEFEGHRRLPRSSFHPGDPANASRYVREVASTADGVLPLISIPLVVATLTTPSGPIRFEKER